ncbi:MAG: hypothetical protein FWE35_13640 [Streptosporangiales bacterium]|nr:hypothetical protein [Streptosporangiales bacterium]
MRNIARGRARIAVAAIVLAGTATGAGLGVPAVMAGTRSAPRSAAPRDWPAAKADRMRAENRLREAAARRPLRPPPAPPAGQSSRKGGRGPLPQAAGGTVTASSSQAGLTSGIVGLAAGGPFGPSQFSGTNLWNGPVGGRWEVVQAGGTPSGRAGVFVYSRSQDPASGEAPRVAGIRVPPSGPEGRFAVRRADGDVLTLSAPGPGRAYRFNVVTLRFSR